MTNPTDVNAPDPGVTDGNTYPMRSTAALLNERLGLYLSDEQQRGLATGLLVGAALGGAVVAWNVTSMLKGRG